MEEDIDMKQQFKIKNLVAPTDNLDAVNKEYIDNDGSFVRNNQHKDMGNNLMTNVNMMFVNRDPSEAADGDDAPRGVTRKAYVDSNLRICYNDKINDLNGNRIANVGTPVENGDVAIKQYVDSRKPIITIWAEERGELAAGSYEWSWGNGGASSAFGYPIMADGRVLRGEVSIEPITTSATIDIFSGGANIGSFSKLTNQDTTITMFDPPLELTQRNFITFRTQIESGTQITSLVSLLIELDI